MQQIHTLNQKDFTSTQINRYYQRLIEAATEKRIAFEQKVSKQPQYTHYHLDFNHIPYSIKDNQIKVNSKLLVTIPNKTYTTTLLPIKVFGLLNDKRLKEEIPITIECCSEAMKQVQHLISNHQLRLNSPIEKEIEPNRSYIPCFSSGNKQLFKYSNKFLIQDNNEEIELKFQSISTPSSLTFEQFMDSIINSSIPKTSFNNKEVVKFLLSSTSIQDELQLTLLTKLVLHLPNIKNLQEWENYLNENKSLNLLPKPFLNELMNVGKGTNPIFFDHYDFIKTYFNHQKRLSN